MLTLDHEHRLALLGERLRIERKRQRVSAVATSEAAGISRVTLHRIERGESSVAVGAWTSVAHALGLTLDLLDLAVATKAKRPPQKIRLRDWPELKRLAWQLQSGTVLTPEEALQLYERNWRHIDRKSLSEREAELIESLSRELGGGRLMIRSLTS